MSSRKLTDEGKDREMAMRAEAFRRLADDFAVFQQSEGVEDSRKSPGMLRVAEPDPVRRPGQWLLGTLGVALTAVGLAYRSGPATVRFLSVVDTRSADEMVEWDGRIARGWLRRNLRAVGAQTRPVVMGLLEGQTDWDHDKWRAIVRDLSVADYGFWGPGEMATSWRLERVMGVFVLARLVAMDLGAPAAQSFMVGSSPWLGGRSPLLHVASGGAAEIEPALAAADQYLAAR